MNRSIRQPNNWLTLRQGGCGVSPEVPPPLLLFDKGSLLRRAFHRFWWLISLIQYPHHGWCLQLQSVTLHLPVRGLHDGVKVETLRHVWNVETRIIVSIVTYISYIIKLNITTDWHQYLGTYFPFLKHHQPLTWMKAISNLHHNCKNCTSLSHSFSTWWIFFEEQMG